MSRQIHYGSRWFHGKCGERGEREKRSSSGLSRLGAAGGQGSPFGVILAAGVMYFLAAFMFFSCF